jgi:hypothetical protein
MHGFHNLDQAYPDAGSIDAGMLVPALNAISAKMLR